MNKVKVLELRPTQFAVGMMEVDEKIKMVSAMGTTQRKAFVKENLVPVVMGYDKKLYVVDKHHFLCVCYHVGIEKVRVDFVKDVSKKKMSYAQFWKWMAKNRSCYPFCQFGEGPRKALYLPKDIRGLADDPYRSLAWFVRKAGAFENTDRNFAEFQWANFFRSKKILDREGLDGFEKALLKAVDLALSPAAKTLPGYGKLNLQKTKKVRGNAKKKMKKVRKHAE